MPIVPYRDIAKGVITDVPPFNLPLGAWSWGSNVRFRNQSITRAPVHRSVKTSLANANPRYLASNVPSSGDDAIIIGYLNGRVTSLVSGAETDVSISGFSNNTADTPFTSCELGDVFYVNRNDRAPWSLLPTASIFATLPNWAPVSSPWTCNLLRASNSALIAFGVTQNGVNYPTTYITSEFALSNAVPTTWDYTAGTNNATRNTLGVMQGPITDACALGNLMIVFGQNETWYMFLSGDANIWNVLPLFSDAGAISANCAVEVDKKQYVFGVNDIWVHDGTSKQSICDQITREFIFGGLNVAKANRCGVAYNKNLKEIYFRYPSNDAFVGFAPVDGCNRQAVYHIPTSTWSFDDLPYVFGAVMANLDNTRAWNTDTFTWVQSGGTWASLQDSAKKVMTFVGDVNAAANLSESIYAFDLQGAGSLVNYAVDTHATLGWTLIRDGIDLHELKKDLRGDAVIHSMYPQAQLEAGAQPINFAFGGATFYGQNTVLAPAQTYDGNTLYKLDFETEGRYLSMNITHNDYHYVNFTGLDLDLDIYGEW